MAIYSIKHILVLEKLPLFGCKATNLLIHLLEERKKEKDANAMHLSVDGIKININILVIFFYNQMPMHINMLFSHEHITWPKLSAVQVPPAHLCIVTIKCPNYLSIYYLLFFIFFTFIINCCFNCFTIHDEK